MPSKSRRNIGRRTNDARRNHQYRLDDETEEDCEQRVEANGLRIAQSRLDITPEQQQQSSSPCSVRAYTKRKLERRLNRQPKSIVQYERLAFRYNSTINYAADVAVDFGTMNTCSML
ncbi:hypothetical protein EVAR_37239_1 [Eumeta japonica]|uniref:Uncharacterized protein n=1 Tax=Eumeta variegata TaxID=151549 RepID=A0A4C1Y8A4_EUMVA|nr:hypothetical protein EVAR_37239_1 [Eumeta japonica]